MKERGFTLIELMVVVVIIGVLAAVAMPRFMRQQDKGKEGGAWADLDAFVLACEMFYMDCNDYPAALEDLDDITAAAAGCNDTDDSWAGPYIAFKKVVAGEPVGPWGVVYTYATSPLQICAEDSDGTKVAEYINKGENICAP